MPRDNNTDYTASPGNPAHYLASRFEELTRRALEDPEGTKDGLIDDLRGCVGRGCTPERYRQICQILKQKAAQGGFALAKYISDFVLKATDRGLGVVQTGPAESLDWHAKLAQRASGNSWPRFLSENFTRLMQLSERQPTVVAREVFRLAPSDEQLIVRAISGSPRALRRYLAESLVLSQGANGVVREATEEASIGILAESLDQEQIKQSRLERQLGKFGFLLEERFDETTQEAT